MDLITVKIHSVVSEITNSSTVIFTYQDGSINPAKELINEMLRLSGVTDKKAEDIFYFGVFCNVDRYLDNVPDGDEYFSNMPEVTGAYRSPERIDSTNARDEYVHDYLVKIMSGEIEKPDWMAEVETDDDFYSPSSYLYLIPKEVKYAQFGDDIRALLNSVTADGGRDG